jgi:hypothetical protein
MTSEPGDINPIHLEDTPREPINQEAGEQVEEEKKAVADDDGKINSPIV